MKRILVIWFLLWAFIGNTKANYVVSGTVVSDGGTALPYATVLLQGTSIQTLTNELGIFELKQVEKGKYTLVVFSYGYNKIEQEINVTGDTSMDDIALTPITKQLSEFEVTAPKLNDFGIGYMNSIEGTAIYAAKKNELVLVADVQGNKATNNARQVFAKVSGLNIWEGDGAGLQLGVGGRGLNPNRTTNFNSRQNGYDISADALGYPESYYTPPTEALETIEVIRGAASLQYGTQFGGVLNFKIKKGVRYKPIEITARQTVGSFGLVNSFLSVGGTKGTTNYYFFGQYKQGNGWRSNSQFNAGTFHGNVNNQITEKLNVGLEYTYMSYLSQQAGGLTDNQFYDDPRQSTRERNWFNVNWNLGAIIIDYECSQNVTINNRLFGLFSSRKALGELGRIDRPDPITNRDFISGEFMNFGNETRVLSRYKLVNDLPSAMLFGVRYYRGNTTSRQGESNDGYEATFEYLDEDNLFSDYSFVNENVALFAENVFTLSKRFSITPGLRYEYIQTQAVGSYGADVYHPNTNELLLELDIDENKSTKRNIFLSGIGVSFKPSERVEIYGNFSQNYRAINFSDIKIVNPNFRVDGDMKDEKGWNSDVGVRGRINDFFAFDVTLFYLRYNNKIGSVLKKDTLTYQSYRLRTNVGDSRNIGVESFVELDLLKALLDDSLDYGFSIFSNLSYIDATYTNSEDASIKKGNKVEYVPSYNLKCGTSLSYQNLKLSYQYTFVSQQFTEATNAYEPVSTAINGIIPSYDVMDVSLSYSYKRYRLEAGINNLLDQAYFTRRATAYPGPGIIPSDGRSFYFTFQVKI